MKLIFFVFASALLAVAADPQPAKKSTAPAAPPAKQTKPLEIPKGAVETEPGTFRYTDTDGKKWMYRKTPFGVARLEDKGTERAAEQTATDPANGIKATEDGDTVRFERPGPFGVYRWQKKKADLDEGERAALERSRAAAKAKQE